jgi:hypothetical protein
MGSAGQSGERASATRYIAAYDTELPGCLEGVRQILRVHERYGIPATFFIVTRLLDEQGDEYRHLLSDGDRFEIASHTCTHRLLRDHPIGGPGLPPEELPGEIEGSKRRLEDVFERRVVGLRSPWGYPDGMRGQRELLRLCEGAGYTYLSTLLWGPDCSMPALLVPPFPYAEEGCADLWELPGCGWQDNVLKAGSGLPPMRLQLFPPAMPEAVALKCVETPEEEMAAHRVFIDKALETGAPCVSFIWHPWSLHRFDPEMRMLDLTFRYVRDVGLEPCTFADWRAALGR